MAKKSRTIVTPGTKVSQSTIDSIKKLGMSEALKLAGKNGKPAGGLAAEFQEGVRRMYGANRLAAAQSKYAPVKSKSADAARSKAMGAKPASKAAVKAVSTKSMSKGSSMSTKAKVVGGTVAAVALAAKGGPAGRKVASKLAPGLAKSAVGRALFGTAPKMSPSSLAKFKASMGPKAAPAKVTVGPKGSFGPTTKTMAKSKLGTASEYASKAGQASARAGIKTPTADAARAAASKVTKKKAAGASLASNKRK